MTKTIELHRQTADKSVTKGYLIIRDTNFRCLTMELLHPDKCRNANQVKMNGGISLPDNRGTVVPCFENGRPYFPKLKKSYGINPLIASGGTYARLLPCQIMLGTSWLTPYELNPDKRPYESLLQWCAEQFRCHYEIELRIYDDEIEWKDTCYDDFLDDQETAGGEDGLVDWTEEEDE